MPTPITPRLDKSGAELLSRHADFWQRKGALVAYPIASQLGRLWLPLTGGELAQDDLDLTPEKVDVLRIVGGDLGPGPIQTVNDQFAHSDPYFPIPWVEAILGLPIRTTIQGGSMRARDQIRSWDQWDFDAPHFDQDWFDLLIRFLDLLAERRGHMHAITQTLMRGPSDLAEAVLGPELMCLSLYDHPAELHRFLDSVTNHFIRVLHAQLDHIPRIEGGVVNPFGVWSPGTVVRNQCDATAFLSADHYAEWFLPYDLRIWRSVDFSIQHIHSNSLHTVDVLLGQELPHAIQVTLDIQPAGPPVERIIPTLRRILSAKPLILEGWMTEDEVRLVRRELPPNGFSLSARTEPY